MKPKLALAVQFAIKPENAPTRHQFRKWALAALETDAEIALRLVDAEEGQTLNRDYRGKDYPTNVLTFPLNDEPLMGDIVLCAPVVAKEAAEQNKSLEAHYAHLTVHGVLHLQGYDHENEQDAEVMEALETQILSKLGYADPYRILENAITHG
jgi:probable rRNA maturation factor